jgi:hypothetical protein
MEIVEGPNARRSPRHWTAPIDESLPIAGQIAGVNYSHRCPKGNRQMRRVLHQAANAEGKAKGTIFAVVYRRLVPRLGHAQAIGAITHRLCRLIWKILHERVRYEERGPAVSVEAKKVRARKMIRELRSLGYSVKLLPPPAGNPAWLGKIFDPGWFEKRRESSLFRHYFANRRRVVAVNAPAVSARRACCWRVELRDHRSNGMEAQLLDPVELR